MGYGDNVRGKSTSALFKLGCTKGDPAQVNSGGTTGISYSPENSRPGHLWGDKEVFTISISKSHPSVLLKG